MTDFPVQDGLSIQFDTTEGDFISAMGMDRAEAIMMELGEPVECPVQHIWFPGLYVRSFTARAGSLVASRIHRTEHPFVILSGDVSIWIEGTGTVRLKGPYQGRTFPGTRRLLYFHEDTQFQTFHTCVDGETVEDIETRILERHHNPLIGMDHRDISRLFPGFIGEAQKITNHDRCVLHNE